MQGWVAIHRSILEHWLHNDKPFCKFGAWIDLVLLANHEEKKFLATTGLITISRGQLMTSYRSLSERWGWSKDKVSRFLNTLESDGMIQRNQDKFRTLLTIVNYGFYQDLQDKNRTQIGQQSDNGRTPIGQQSDSNRTPIGQNNNVTMNNNEEQCNNENNETSDTVPADASSAPKKKYGQFQKVRLTDEEYNRLCGDYGQKMTEKAIDFLDAYIEEKGYKSKCHNIALRRWVFDAVKERDSKNRNKTPQHDTFSKWGLTQEDFNT